MKLWDSSLMSIRLRFSHSSFQTSIWTPSEKWLILWTMENRLLSSETQNWKTARHLSRTSRPNEWSTGIKCPSRPAWRRTQNRMSTTCLVLLLSNLNNLDRLGHQVLLQAISKLIYPSFRAVEGLFGFVNELKVDSLLLDLFALWSEPGVEVVFFDFFVCLLREASRRGASLASGLCVSVDMVLDVEFFFESLVQIRVFHLFAGLEA